MLDTGLRGSTSLGLSPRSVASSALWNRDGEGLGQPRQSLD